MTECTPIFPETCPKECPRVFMDYVTDEGETKYGEFDNTFNVITGQCHLSEVAIGTPPEDQLAVSPEVIVPTEFATLELQPVNPPVLFRSGGFDLALMFVGLFLLLGIIFYVVESLINKD